MTGTPEHAVQVTDVSTRAIALALSSADRTSPAIFSTLYLYNRLPPPPYWREALSDKDAVAAFLGLGRVSASLGRAAGPQVASVAGESAPWWYWRFDDSMADDLRVKVYVAPHPNDLPDVLTALTDLLQSCPASGMKIAADASGLLRPDKCMVYFNELSAARSFARDLAARSTGARPHPVPFAQTIDSSSGVYLGFDPPARQSRSAPPSWRAMVATRITDAIVDARRSLTDRQPNVDDVFVRLRAGGIDPEIWAPCSSMWAI